LPEAESVIGLKGLVNNTPKKKVGHKGGMKIIDVGSQRAKMLNVEILRERS